MERPLGRPQKRHRGPPSSVVGRDRNPNRSLPDGHEGPLFVCWVCLCVPPVFRPRAICSYLFLEFFERLFALPLHLGFPPLCNGTATASFKGRGFDRSRLPSAVSSPICCYLFACTASIKSASAFLKLMAPGPSPL